MFSKLKDKLSGWIKKSKETVEESVVDAKVEVEMPKAKTKKKGEEKIIKETPEMKSKKSGGLVEEVAPSGVPSAEGKVPSEVGSAEGKIEEEDKTKIEEEIVGKVEEKKSGFFSKVKSSFKYQISEEGFDEIFDDLEMLLLENNVALEVVDDLKKKLSGKLVGKEIKKEDLEKEIRGELKNSLNEVLIEPDDPLDAVGLKKGSGKPFVILFFGINGTGKTTSIAKMADLLKRKGFSVVLAAGDTFRAASIEQISIHASKLNVPLIKHDYGSDPSAVGFDAIKYAEKHRIDVVLIDTAGRMHTKTNLLSEMEKIVRVSDPDLKIFVAESIAGNDAVEQARAFNEMIEIDGSILSKADIDEKGGTIISVSHATHKPIFYLGVGQEYKDLKLFDKQEFIDSLGL